MKRPEIVPFEDRPFDLVVFGATGFTGKLITRHLATHIPTSLTWAIAGRNPQKLQRVYDDLEDDCSIHRLPDILDFALHEPRSIIRSTKVVLSVVGPYTYHGEKFLQLCVEEGTCWVDLTGEIPWAKEMIERYGEQAKQTGSILIPSCGYESVPSDLGCLILSRHMGSRLGRVQAVFEDASGGVSGGSLSSIVAYFSQYDFSTEIGGPTGFLHNPYYLLPDHDTSSLPAQRTDPETQVIPPGTFYYNEPNQTQLHDAENGYIGTCGLTEATNRAVVFRTLGLQSHSLSNSPDPYHHESLSPYCQPTPPPTIQQDEFYGPDFNYREYFLMPPSAISSMAASLTSHILHNTIPYFFSFSAFRHTTSFFINKFFTESDELDGDYDDVSSNGSDIPRRKRKHTKKPAAPAAGSGGFRLRLVGKTANQPEEDPHFGYVTLRGSKSFGSEWSSTIAAETAVYLCMKLRGLDTGTTLSPYSPEDDILEGWEASSGDMIFGGCESGRQTPVSGLGIDMGLQGRRGRGGFWTPASLGVGIVRWLGKRGLNIETGWGRGERSEKREWSEGEDSGFGEC
ncbi:hypothetical protein BJ508DRAFT_323423 [Ascobolus immersus RN42]|uniref:Uncharacterized protein n=1 Tax=Ascobolus immersus RN42 TaxID=1160509 RepID=A0A3N4IFW1_ASCIM|nr:hypothetical protein BJ508DRAFT_323423 [Ascobolus immersus RN42]